jgi:hypothetical protein
MPLAETRSHVTGERHRTCHYWPLPLRKFRGVDADRRYARSSGALAFVATEGPELVGWCWGYHLRRPDGFSVLYLHDVEVDEPYRLQGVRRRSWKLRGFRPEGWRFEDVPHDR